MKMARNVLSLSNEDCQTIQEGLNEGKTIREALAPGLQEMYKGGIDDLEGIEIPADYWHFVMELDEKAV
jgi:hypothetical protein